PEGAKVGHQGPQGDHQGPGQEQVKGIRPALIDLAVYGIEGPDQQRGGGEQGFFDQGPWGSQEQSEHQGQEQALQQSQFGKSVQLFPTVGEEKEDSGQGKGRPYAQKAVREEA